MPSQDDLRKLSYNQLLKRVSYITWDAENNPGKYAHIKTPFDTPNDKRGESNRSKES
jgi:hypothetical protein